jgi:hypothetical protein
MDSKIQELNDKLALAHLGGGKRQNCKTTPEEIDRQRACELFDG